MLFDIEKQVAGRWYIDKHEVCPGCPFYGQAEDEESFCIMRQDPPGCAIAVISRRFEKIRFYKTRVHAACHDLQKSPGTGVRINTIQQARLICAAPRDVFF